MLRAEAPIVTVPFGDLVYSNDEENHMSYSFQNLVMRL